MTESFGLSGIGEFGRIDPVEGEPADWRARFSPDALPDTLLSLSRRGTPKAQTNDELRRLRARSPLRIAEPVFHGTDTGLLFLDEE